MPHLGQFRPIRSLTCHRQRCSFSAHRVHPGLAFRPTRAHHRQRISVTTRAGYDDFSVLGPNFNNKARLTEGMVKSVMELPMTRGISDLRDRVDALSAWKLALSKGVLPNAEEVSWPAEPFRSKFIEALNNLEMARFTRRYPAVLNTLVNQMLELVADFEQKLVDAEGQAQQRQQQQQQQQSSTPPPQDQQQQQGGDGGGGGDAGDQGDMEEMMQEAMEEAMQEVKQEVAQQGGEGQQLQVSLQQQQQQQSGDGQDEGEQEGAMQEEEVRQMAEDLVEQWEAKMQGVMQNLQRAQDAFDDLSELMEGPAGFDLSKGTWRKGGWKELEELRKKLENLKELRDLVRSLGRAGGKGPLRRAPEEVEAAKYPPGVVRSPLQPEQVSGLARSGELSRMAPPELALLAAGYRRRGGSGDDHCLRQGEDDGSVVEGGMKGARLLHLARRAERNLLSYDRTGWLDDIPARVTGRFEIRPAAEQGPIIVCLDTSGSMRGARETVAKALALECLRGAHRQRRACFLYAFSGPGEVQELELGVDLQSLDRLLEFLSGSFMGGTDVDLPLELSLRRLQDESWSQADILMVTDGEIQPPATDLLERVQTAKAEMGLEVHGLLVADQVTEAMTKLCSHVHIFKSWTAAGGRDFY